MSNIRDTSFFNYIIDQDNKIYRNEEILSHFLSMTTEEENCRYVMANFPSIIGDIVSIIINEKNLCNIAADILINFSTFEDGAGFLANSAIEHLCTSEEVPLVRLLLEWALDTASIVADSCCQILANLTRLETVAVKLAESLTGNVEVIYAMIDAITDETYNTKGRNLEYMSHVVANMTQSYGFRRFLVEYDDSCLNRLMSVITKRQSNVRKDGVISVIKNSCFDIEFHDILLGPKFNLLPNILYPLAGPEQIDYSVYQNLPPDLQYLPPDKERENTIGNRTKLIQSLYQLSATRAGRRFLRDKDTFIILKHYYNWEISDMNKSICEDVIGLLIRAEEEIGIDNLKEVRVPEDISNRFEKLDIT